MPRTRAASSGVKHTGCIEISFSLSPFHFLNLWVLVPLAQTPSSCMAGLKAACAAAACSESYVAE